MKGTPIEVTHGITVVATICRGRCAPCEALRDRKGHGRIVTYSYGCRCSKCCEASSAYYRDWYAKGGRPDRRKEASRADAR